MPGPLSNPDGNKSVLRDRKRASGEVVSTGKTAVKRRRRSRNGDDE